jgi:hypothetical protein
MPMRYDGPSPSSCRHRALLLRGIATGYLQWRRGAGFYAASASAPADATHADPSDKHKRNEELVWLIRRLLEPDEETVLAG